MVEYPGCDLGGKRHCVLNRDADDEQHKGDGDDAQRPPLPPGALLALSCQTTTVEAANVAFYCNPKTPRKWGHSGPAEPFWGPGGCRFKSCLPDLDGVQAGMSIRAQNPCSAAASRCIMVQFVGAS